MKSRSASKIKLTSYEELLGASSEDSVDVEISRIRDFKGHPFRVLDDKKMEELVESIHENGVLTPVIVRPDGADGYEMISGHRRRHAAGLWNPRMAAKRTVLKERMVLTEETVRVEESRFVIRSTETVHGSAVRC